MVGSGISLHVNCYENLYSVIYEALYSLPSCSCERYGSVVKAERRLNDEWPCKRRHSHFADSHHTQHTTELWISSLVSLSISELPLVTRRAAGYHGTERQVLSLYQDRDSLLKEEIQVREGQKQDEGAVLPFCRMPTEILASILGFAFPTRDGLLGRAERSQFKRYRQVSWLWRETLFSSPSLRCSIHIGLDDAKRDV